MHEDRDAAYRSTVIIDGGGRLRWSQAGDRLMTRSGAEILLHHWLVSQVTDPKAIRRQSTASRKGKPIDNTDVLAPLRLQSRSFEMSDSDGLDEGIGKCSTISQPDVRQHHRRWLLTSRSHEHASDGTLAIAFLVRQALRVGRSARAAVLMTRSTSSAFSTSTRC